MTAPNVAQLPDMSWLDDKHDVYTRFEKAWQREERRMNGGDDVLDELWPFDYETKGKDQHLHRQAEATYINLPLLHASMITGHLRRQAPSPNFGTLGEVREREDIKGNPSMAELIFYNVDGIGADGNQWDAWWDAVQDRVQATGIRWLMAEAPRNAPATFQDVLNGARPYLVEYSPLEVTNWFFKNGELMFAVVRVDTYEPKVDGGRIRGREKQLGYYLLVRSGYDGLGAEFSTGGWWLLDGDKNLLDAGDWSKTHGRIPMWVHYGLIAKGRVADPRLAISGTMELGQLAVSLMNLMSARDFNAWHSARSATYLTGMDPEGFSLAMDMAKEGSVFIPLRGIQKADGTEEIPTITFSAAGAIEGQVFQSLISQKWEEAKKVMIDKVSSAPDSSGASKNAGFLEGSSPLLSRYSKTREQSENNAIYWLELRAGNAKPFGSVMWPNEFDLAPLVDDIDAMFTTLTTAGVQSPTLTASLIQQALEERALSKGLDMKKVMSEITTSIEEKKAQAQARSDALSAMTGGGTKPPKDDAADDEKKPELT